eukprot:11735641-Karenia_brevis.AAC.1
MSKCKRSEAHEPTFWCVSCYIAKQTPYRKPASAFGAKDRREWQGKILSQGARRRCSQGLTAICANGAQQHTESDSAASI